MKTDLGLKEAMAQLAQKGYAPAVAYRYFCDGKYSRAVDSCLKLLETNSELLSVRLILARSLYHSGQYDNARKQFLDILKADDENLRALKYLGDISFRDGQKATAMAYYRRILEIDRFCTGLSCEIHEQPAVSLKTQPLTLKKGSEPVVSVRKKPLQEPAFVTETIADIYRDQGYYRLAEEVYHRLLASGNENRIAVKLRAVEEKIRQKGRD